MFVCILFFPLNTMLSTFSDRAQEVGQLRELGILALILYFNNYQVSVLPSKRKCLDTLALTPHQQNDADLSDVT